MSKKIGDWWNSKEMRQSRPALILIIAFFVLVFFYKHGLDVISKTDDDYTLNVHTEVFGFALALLVTVYVIDNLNRRRDDQRRKQELIDRLLREVRSPEAVIARHALHEIRDRGMLTGDNGLLKGQNLSGMKWEGSVLDRANLACAVLPYSCLQGAQLNEAYFEGATLWFSNLERVQCSVGANFRDTKMNGATFAEARLYYVDFLNADLQETDFGNSFLFGTKLKNANLRTAKIKYAQINEVSFLEADLFGAEIENNFYHGRIVLPDGSIMKDELDFARFTGLNHPDS